MRSAQSGLLALQGALEADDDSASDTHESADDDSSSVRLLNAWS
jgi:hypothetical protein